MTARTLFDKIWDAHVVTQDPDSPAILYIDLHLIHEVTSPQAFDGLRTRGLPVRRRDKTVATIDHSIPTVKVTRAQIHAATLAPLPFLDSPAAIQVEKMEQNAREFGVRIYDFDSDQRGIVHVIGPELGFTLPGMTIVCGDSHTSTHGAFGALAFGVGTSEVEHVLATQCLLQHKPLTYEVQVEGKLPRGVVSKDIILALIAKIGIGGGTGHIFEYTGSAIRALSMEARMTICNMSIEGGARAGLVAPDETTYAYLATREFAPKEVQWDAALARWKQLPTDAGAAYDKTTVLRADELQPMITFGTNPGMGMPITERIPDSKNLEKALTYMNLVPGRPLLGHPIDLVFIGSCTNSRISDLRLAAQVLKGKHIAPNMRALVVPGSQQIKKQAEQEGLDKIFLAAGAEWRESGCSMCLAMNGDAVPAGKYCVSTSNRNFEGRQGQGARTFLASPLTAAASAIKGAVADPREFIE